MLACALALRSTIGIVLATIACAHAPKSGDLESLRLASEALHQRIRWKDFQAVAALLVPEKREAFLAAVRERNDERDLNVTDVELQETKLLDEGTRAVVVAHVRWHRLPSDTEEAAVVRSELVWRAGAWLLERQRGGPFADYFSEEP